MSPGGRHIRIDPSKTQGFKVKSYYKALRGGTIFIPRKHFFFFFLGIHCQSILESLSSIKAGFLGKIIMDWCFMCKSQEKRVSHRFLHCREAWEMWSLIFCLFGVSLVMPSSVLELLSCWKKHFGKRRDREIWNIVPLCIMLCCWRQICSMLWRAREAYGEVEVFSHEDFLWLYFNFPGLFHCGLSGVLGLFFL